MRKVGRNAPPDQPGLGDQPGAHQVRERDREVERDLDERLSSDEHDPHERLEVRLLGRTQPETERKIDHERSHSQADLGLGNFMSPKLEFHGHYLFKDG